MQFKYGIIGAGIWGTVFGNFLAKKGINVKIWAYEKEVKENINKKRENTVFLKNHKLDDKLFATNDLEDLRDIETIFNAIPVPYMEKIWKKTNLNSNGSVINLSKGIEVNTLNFPYDIIKKYTKRDIYVLSGPSFAKELYDEMKTAVVLSGEINNKAKTIQKELSNDILRVYLNKDIKGVEVCSALKNVLAIASGIVDGMGYGKNTQAALITRGIAEITRLGKIMGANIKTFSGLAGLGDFILTCTSKMSRNYSFGYYLAKKEDIEFALENAGGIVEGYYTVKNAKKLSKKYKVDMPIIEGIYDIIYNEIEINKVLKRLMSRELKNELWGL